MVKKRRRAVYKSAFPARLTNPGKHARNPQRNILITPGGFAMLLGAHKGECERCRKLQSRKTPTLCEKGAAIQRGLTAAMERAAWREPQKLPIPDGPLGSTFNPRCRHDRCAYTIAHCPACIAYVPPETDGN